MKKRLMIGLASLTLNLSAFAQETVDREQIDRANETFDVLSKIVGEVEEELDLLEQLTRISKINQQILEQTVKGRTPAEAQALRKAFSLKTKVAIYSALAPLTKKVADEYQTHVDCLVALNNPLMGDPDVDCHFSTVNTYLNEEGVDSLNRKVQELEAELASTSYQLDALQEKLDSINGK